MSIFTVTDIDLYVIDHLDVNTMISLMQTNSYYYNTINDNKLYSVTKKFHQCKAEISKIRVDTYYHRFSREQDKLFVQSCGYGDLAIIKYLLSCNDIDIHASDDQGFALACENGHLNICQFLYLLDGKVDISTGYYRADLTLDYEAPLVLACRNGKFNVVKWLLQTGKVSVHEQVFINACEYGHLNIAQFLYDYDGTVDIHAHNDYVLFHACHNGRLAIVEWLLSVDDFDITRNNRRGKSALALAAENDHLCIVKYLCGIYPNYNICDNDNIIFKTCCRCRALTVAQWIYSLDNSIDISELFIECCYCYDNLHVVKWLHSIDSHTDITIAIKQSYLNIMK